MLLFTMHLELLAPGKAVAAYYSYEDRDGTIHFVDDASKIPREYSRKKTVRKDAYDDLPEEERARLLQKEQEERASARQREGEQQENFMHRRAMEKKRAAREQQQEALTTHVVISGRQVFVPVKLGFGSEETNVMLLLDTGASTSVITPEVAARLKIEEAENVKVGVVGGKVVRAKKVVLSQIVVGPISKTGQEAVIVRQRSSEFGDGLLGMNFLSGLKYTIDFEKQTINWIP